MKKIFSVILLIVFLSACQPSPTPAQTSTPALTQTRTPAPNRTATVALTSTATEMAMVTETSTIYPKILYQTEVAGWTPTSTLVPCIDSSQEPNTERTAIMESYFNYEVRQEWYGTWTYRENASYLDLETGSGYECENIDIYYQLDCGSQCFPMVRIWEKVMVVEVGDQKPSLEQCEEVIASYGDLVHSIREEFGAYFCIKTREGNYGWVRYDDDFWMNLEYGQIQITYYLWGD